MEHHKKNNNWRNQKMGTCYKPRSYNNRRSSFCWQPPSWEKKFCARAGVPWQKVLETKKYMYQDEKVLQWNDSAVKEAFLNAKKRFWAEIHSQPCDIKLPDPDIFIDKIDWDSSIDPDLINDLDKRQVDTPCNTDGGVVVGIPVVPEQYLHTPNGWGDVEEVDPKLQNYEQYDGNNGYDHWEDTNVVKDLDNNNGSTTWNNHHLSEDWNKSRYKISRFHHNDYGKSLVNDNGNKKGNFGFERPWIQWRPVTKGC